MVVPLRWLVGKEAALLVEIIPRLCQNGHASTGQLPKAVHGLLEKRLVLHHGIVVEKDGGVEIEHVRNQKAKISYRTITGKAYLVADGNAQLLHTLPDQRQLRSADDRNAQVGKVLGDRPCLACRLVLNGRLGRDKNNDMTQASYFSQ